MTKPISPDEVVVEKQKTIPKEVIESFNEIVAKKWDGHSSVFKQKDVVRLILEKMNSAVGVKNEGLLFSSSFLCTNGFLDVEPIYEDAGWDVYYDKPGFNESYDATFKFATFKFSRSK